MALVRRVFSLSTQQGEWLDAQGARLGISWGEYLRRLIDEKRVPPPDPAPSLDSAFVAAYVSSLAPETGGAAEAWQTLCRLGAYYKGYTTTQTADLLCQVTGKARGAVVTMADCVATLRAMVEPAPDTAPPVEHPEGQAA